MPGFGTGVTRTHDVMLEGPSTHSSWQPEVSGDRLDTYASRNSLSVMQRQVSLRHVLVRAHTVYLRDLAC